MKVPKEIAEKVERYQELQNGADKLYEEIKQYFEELGAEGFEIPFITDKPEGHLQNDDEYCDQAELGEDWYRGNYYYQIENSDKYIGYSFEI